MRRGIGFGAALAVLASVSVLSAQPAFAVTVNATPTDNLTDGQVISATSPDAVISTFVGQCGNAYADGTPLADLNPTTDCASPSTPGPWKFLFGSGPGFQVRQSGIGTGNRSCVVVANFACSLRGNFAGPVDLSFASDLAPGTPIATTTNASGPSLPVAVGKSFGVRTHVSINGNFYPDGTVTVSDTNGVLGTGSLSLGEAAVTVPAGLAEGTHELAVHYNGNGSFEPSDTTVGVTVSGGTNTVAIGDVAMYESLSGKGYATFPVVLSNPSPLVPVTVGYNVTGGTAVAGTDFTAVSGTLTFLPKRVVQYLRVPVLFRAIPTPSVDFQVTLSSPTGGYEITRAVGVGTLKRRSAYDSGGAIASMSVPEGDSGPNHQIRIPITMGVPAGAQRQYNMEFERISAVNAPRSNEGDYFSQNPRLIKIGGTARQRFLAVTIIPDTRAEGDEVFRVSFNGSTGVELSALITILGDD